MLTFEQVKKTYGSLEPDNQRPRPQLVEYLQYELLDSIFKQKESERISFMGGTAIRIAYFGNRFSEDLDFDGFHMPFESFSRMLGSVVKDMKDKGFDIEFRSVKQNAFHCYIKFPKILSDNSLSFHENEKILVKIDMLERAWEVAPRKFLINRFELYRNILVNPPAVVLAEKLIALRDRKREKGRDFYDVSFLYGSVEPDFEFIEKTMDISRNEFMGQILERCRTLDFGSLAADVEPLLIKRDQIARVRDFLSFWETKVGPSH
jgi:predicted nucleotidyltransferase component of viral defense system